MTTTPLDVLLWGVYPYVALAMLVVITVIRRIFFPQTWTSKSSQFLESKLERVGVPAFHIGIVMVFFGHLGGLSVPKALTDQLGVTEHMYHTVALGMGGLMGTLAVVGLVVLLVRRFGGNRRMRANTSTMDRVLYVLLVLTIALGMTATLSNAGGGYVYRDTLGPWFRGIMTFQPLPDLLASAPLVYKAHILCGLTVFAVLPFTRLVHIFSGVAAPFKYAKRKAVLYRERRLKQHEGERDLEFPAGALQAHK